MKNIKGLFVVEGISKGYYNLIAVDEDGQNYKFQCAPYEPLYLVKMEPDIEAALKHADEVSSTHEKARDYLLSEGVDPDKLVEEGIKKIQELRKKGNK